MNSLTLEELRIWSRENSLKHGWRDTPRSVAELLCLIHSEVSEALEEDRNHHQPNETYYSGQTKFEEFALTIYAKFPTVQANKPEGIPSELADIILRVMDFADQFDIELDAALREKMAYNETRPVRHGGKKL